MPTCSSRHTATDCRRYDALYAADLEAIQKLYEKHKAAPPLPRNAPPVAGKIMWAKHLLHRIEAPMARWAVMSALPMLHG